MFVPRQPWEYLLAKLAVDKEAAKTYEQYFNDIISSVRDKGNFQQVSVSTDTIKDSFFFNYRIQLYVSFERVFVYQRNARTTTTTRFICMTISTYSIAKA